MVFGLLLVGFFLLMLVIGISGFGLVAFGASRAVSQRYRIPAVVGVCALPFAYYWCGQWRLDVICGASSLPSIIETRQDVEGFYYSGPSDYAFEPGPVLFAGFKFFEQHGSSGYKFRKTVDIGGLKDSYSNTLSSAYDVVVSNPSLYSAVWSIYSQEMIVRERLTGRVLGKLTDYLWGGPQGSFFGWYVQLFLGRSFVSCGPGLKKGWANQGIGYQRRQGEYLRRDVDFVEAILRSGS